MAASETGTPKSHDSSPVEATFASVEGQDETAPPQTQAGTTTERGTSTGGPNGLPPPVYPQRPAPPPGPQAHEKLLKPPYAAPQVATGSTTKSDYAEMSSSKMVETIIAQAARDAAVAAAAELHPDDPQAASHCVVDAMQSVLTSKLASSNTPATERTTPISESKLSQQAILTGICDNKDLDKTPWEKEKGMLYKNAKLIPTFPGSRCRHEPDVWEDWWERVYAIQNTINCSDTMLAFMIKHAANKDSELYQTLEHLKHTDGSLFQQGLEGVKKLITEDYAPSGHLIKVVSRDRVRASWRRYKQKPSWWFRRFDRYMEVCLLYTSPSPRDLSTSRMPSSA